MIKRNGKKKVKNLNIRSKLKKLNLSQILIVHDLETKIRHAREFIAKGNKVKVTCTFRGREMAHPEIGEKLMQNSVMILEDVAMVESPSKLFGRMLIACLHLVERKRKKAPSRSPQQRTNQPGSQKAHRRNERVRLQNFAKTQK